MELNGKKVFMHSTPNTWDIVFLVG